jgi:hypothetical protein
MCHNCLHNPSPPSLSPVGRGRGVRGLTLA